MQGAYWLRPIVLAAGGAFALLLLAAFWVPIDLHSREPYRAFSLLFGIQPRALLGTVAQVLQLGVLDFKALKVCILFGWLFLLLWQFARHLRLGEHLDSQGLTIFVALGFIYAFGTVTFLTYSPAGFIDVAPFFLTLLVVWLTCERARPDSWPTVAVITVLLVMAVMAHEQEILSIGILAVWFSWKFGLRTTTRLLGPGILLGAGFLALVATRKSTGLPPVRYLDILLSGFEFLQQWSLNVWGIIAGGGAFWFLYAVFAIRFVSATESARDRWQRCAVVIAMLLICMSALLIAADTNRMVGLLWLPVLLLMQEIDLRKLFDSRQARAALIVLCGYQFLIPPVLIYNHGVLPLNCYSLSLARHLPAQASVDPATAGPAGLYLLARPDLSRPLEARCDSGPSQDSGNSDK